MTIQNDPLRAIIKSAKNIYPKTEAIIQYFASPEFENGVDKIEDERFSNIEFPKDGDIPIIRISGNVSFEIMIELLCMRLASAVVGLPNRENGEVWNSSWDENWFEVYSNIKHEYSNKAKK